MKPVILVSQVIPSLLDTNSDYVFLLNEEFCLCLVSPDLHLTQNEDIVEEPSSTMVKTAPAPCLTSREWTPIDNFNQHYVNTVMDRHLAGQTHNFVRENIVRFFDDLTQ